MPYDPSRHHRRSIRLKGYDYSQANEYVVTLCVKDRERLLGEVVGEQVKLTEIGEIVREEWLRTPIVRPDVTLDEFVIMPHHLHGIVVISEERNGVIRRGELQFAPTRVLNDHGTPFRSPSKTLELFYRCQHFGPDTTWEKYANVRDYSRVGNGHLPLAKDWFNSVLVTTGQAGREVSGANA